MAAFSVFAVVVLGLLTLAFVVAPWSYRVGASIVGVHKPSFGAALLATILAFVASIVVNIAVGWVPVIGGILGLVGTVIAAVVVLQMVFEVSFTEGLFIEVISILICSVVGVVFFLVLFMFGLSAAAFGDIAQSVGM